MTKEELRLKQHSWNSKSYEQRRRELIRQKVLHDTGHDWNSEDEPFQFNAREYLKRFETIETRR